MASENQARKLAYMVHDNVAEARELLDVNNLEKADISVLQRAAQDVRAALESIRAAVQSSSGAMSNS